MQGAAFVYASGTVVVVVVSVSEEATGGMTVVV